jgi:hypothetical protein
MYGQPPTPQGSMDLLGMSPGAPGAFGTAVQPPAVSSRGAQALAPGVDIMTYPGASSFPPQVQLLAIKAVEESPAFVACNASAKAMQHGALDSGRALTELRDNLAVLLGKYEELVTVTTAVVPPATRTSFQQRAAALKGSVGGFGQAVNATLKELQGGNQHLNGLDDLRSDRDFALSSFESHRR